MKSSSESLSLAIQPILDTFLNHAVALTGCHTYGIARASCEYDILVVSEEEKPDSSMRVSERYCDISFMSREEAMNPATPELAVALASLVPLRDSSWTLSTAASANKAMFASNAERSAESRLSLALKGLGKADEALGKNSTVDADFWLTAAGYDFALASIYASEVPPAPSHVLKQMKTISSTGEASFTEWSASVGLEQSSIEACAKRLDGLLTVYDIVSSSGADARSNRLIEARRTEHAAKILHAKAGNLIDSLQSVDCFAYLGYEAVLTLFSLLELQSIKESVEPEYGAILSVLTKGRLGIISEEVIKELGWRREDKTLTRAADLLRQAISDQAKRI